MVDTPTVVAVVLNYNNYEDTVACIESLKKQTYKSLHLCIVDNGSSDKSDNRLECEFPNVSIYRTGENLGFAGGMNFGADMSSEFDPDYLWLLNNDVRIPDPHTLDQLVDTVETSNDIGVIHPLIRMAGSKEYWFEKGNINWQNGSVSHIKPSQNNRLIDCDYVPMTAALIDKQLFDSIDGLPRDYFMYYEDVEFCVSVQDLGSRSVTLAETEISHDAGNTSGGHIYPLSTYYRTRNRLLFIRRHSERIESYLFSYILDVIADLLVRIVKRRFDSVAALFMGLKDGIYGNFGKGRYPK